MTEQKLLPPWKSGEEKPIENNNLVFKSEENTYHVAVCEDNGQVSMYDDSNPFTGKKLPAMVCWCYLDDLIEQATRPTGDVQILVEGLEEMARQKTIDEFEEEDKDNGDYMYAYDYIVNKARNTLTAYEASKKGGGE